MGILYQKLTQDYRIKEGLKACINCGTCTAICPAAEFYKYNPKTIVNIVQSQDDDQIEELLKGEQIWYCGECMSCVTRCPRKNAPGLVIMALRSLSIDMGYFVESEKGRQQLPLTRAMCGNILNYGYCVYPRTYKYEDHPESGPVGKWIGENLDAVHERLGSNLDGKGPGVLRKIPQESLDELKAIFDVTGATRRMKVVEEASKRKAEEMGLSMEEYEKRAFNVTGTQHLNHKI
ncbi:MAG: 4Fe-4S dicluster domain-containing protein [Bacteroidales bacterium]|nr:4Fe-4S dicluster domain-containing protein [Bacteroidales bacterium]MDD4669937.1 4Fe-4S dicluster domain-containing protein [Bacteroidales bacterium]